MIGIFCEKIGSIEQFFDKNHRKMEKILNKFPNHRFGSYLVEKKGFLRYTVPTWEIFPIDFPLSYKGEVWVTDMKSFHSNVKMYG